ncbi:MAG: hypothetical protein PHI27_11895 [Eubacteriales bacterium]|nr:hypothetical protein [Eubacteriales bacterium]MDD3882932.1 hypothetical protein [Eubacteriales bacterium]MDD4513521.1 hypothetical protein [Eubacteriales bacterium]
MDFNELIDGFGIIIVIIVAVSSLLSIGKKKKTTTVYKKMLDDYNSVKEKEAPAKPVKHKIFVDYAPKPQAPNGSMPNTSAEGDVTRSRDGRMMPTEHTEMSARLSENTVQNDAMNKAAGNDDGEGVDSCHAYMLDKEQNGDYVNVYENAPDETAGADCPLSFTKDALLQGVIFSEILTRPALRKKTGITR